MSQKVAASTYRRSSGFTLVELLVVVAIIVVLASMLTPALFDAVDSGKQTKCVSNLRSMDLAFTGYVYAHQGEVFGLQQSFDDFWMERIRPFCPDLDTIRYCPKAKVAVPGKTKGSKSKAWSGRHMAGAGQSLLHKGKKYHEGSYGLNGWLYKVEESTQPMTRKLGLDPNRFLNDMFNLDSYVSTPVLADSVWVNGWPEAEHDDGLGTSLFDINRHGDGINVVFLDGHAQHVPLKDLHYLTWHQSFPTGPRGHGKSD